MEYDRPGIPEMWVVRVGEFHKGELLDIKEFKNRKDAQTFYNSLEQSVTKLMFTEGDDWAYFEYGYFKDKDLKESKARNLLTT